MWAPEYAETMDHTTKKHNHNPRGGTTLRITKDTRGGVPIHQKRDDIKRRIVTLTPNQGINKNIKDDHTEGQPCAQKPTARKQQRQLDHDNFPDVLDTKRHRQHPAPEPTKRTRQKPHRFRRPNTSKETSANPPLKEAIMHRTNKV